MEQVPQELNWVKVRAECTIRSIFKQLRHEIEVDVARRNEYLSDSQRGKGIKFSVEEKDDESFVVYRNEPGITASVSFAIIGSYIKTIDPKGTATMEVTVGMNDTGRCMLRVYPSEIEKARVVEIENWLFRKKALEGLFFTAWS